MIFRLFRSAKKSIILDNEKYLTFSCKRHNTRRVHVLLEKQLRRYVVRVLGYFMYTFGLLNCGFWIVSRANIFVRNSFRFCFLFFLDIVPKTIVAAASRFFFFFFEKSISVRLLTYVLKKTYGTPVNVRISRQETTEATRQGYQN